MNEWLNEKKTDTSTCQHSFFTMDKYETTISEYIILRILVCEKCGVKKQGLDWDSD